MKYFWYSPKHTFSYLELHCTEDADCLKFVLWLVLPSPDPCGPIHKYLHLVRSGGACSERDMNNVEARTKPAKLIGLPLPSLACLASCLLPSLPSSLSHAKAFLVNFRFYVKQATSLRNFYEGRHFERGENETWQMGVLVALGALANFRIDQLFVNTNLSAKKNSASNYNFVKRER